MSPAIVRVALPLPLPQAFDYTAENISAGDLGRCVRVPFGRGEKTGLIVALPDAADLPVESFDAPGAATAGTTSFTVQCETPDVASVSQGESLVRAIPGVRSAATSSLALGGMSVMQVSFEGNVRHCYKKYADQKI